MQLTGICVFITGGAGGIGAACARKLLQNGANVCLADMDESKGRRLVEGFSSEFGSSRSRFVKCSVTEMESFKKAVQTCVATFKHIDVMVNNAGLFNESCWEKMLLVNLNGTIIGTELALEHMRKDKGGRGGAVINVASSMGFAPFFGAPVYTASKHGVVGYTRALATAPDVDRLGVRYACICPEAVDTTMLHIQPSNVVERFYGDVTNILDAAGKMKPEAIAEGLVSLIEDDDSNDTLLHISRKDGSVRRRVLVEELK